MTLMVELLESRKSEFTYTEKKVKGALQKVTLELKGTNSATITRLAKRYDRLDQMAKAMKERRDELNASIKILGDDLFDAEDTLATRIIETVSFTVMLTAAEKAHHKQPTKKIDFERAFNDLLALVPELEQQAQAILDTYTEIIPPKDTPTAVKVKTKVNESLYSTIHKLIKQMASSVRKWANVYDRKLNSLKKTYAI